MLARRLWLVQASRCSVAGAFNTPFMPAQSTILIAGGGPVGVVTALALARQGIPVHVFEADGARQ